MQYFTELRTWLDNDISENPLMILGGSIESVFELANNGRLPPCIADDPGSSISLYTEGRLYFSPISSNFRGGKYAELSKVTKKKAFKHVRFYAGMNAFHNYVASRLGCINRETYNIIKDLEDAHKGALSDIQELFKKEGFNLTLNQLATLKRDARKRKGVIIEPDRRILELPHCVPIDDSEAIAVECLHGLDKGYIKGIELLGPVEERSMKRFLADKLKYEGFRIEGVTCY